MKRLHIGVTDEMHKCVKLFATYHDITVNDLICKSIRLYMNTQNDFANTDLLKAEISKMNESEITTDET